MAKTKRKQTFVVNYKKENTADRIDKNEFIGFIKESTELYLLQEAFYNDDTQSFTIQVHFKNKPPNR